MIATLNPILSAEIEAPCPDPVFAFLEEHRAAHAAWAPLSEAWNSLPLTDPAYAAAEEAEREPGDRVRAALAALTAARPTTLPGVLALAGYLPDALRRASYDAEEPQGERVLRSIADALRTLIPPAAAAQPDPVLAAIAASRAVEAAMKAFQATAETPTTPEWRAREGVLSEAQVDAQNVVWRTVPTTWAGRRALVDYARFMVEVFTGLDGCVDSPEGMLALILDAMAAAIGAESVPPAQDADEAQALALVDAIERAWVQDACRSRRDRADTGLEAKARRSALDERDALIDAAERTSAGTRAGRHAKALVLAWLDHVELWRPDWPRSRYATDGRLVFDIEASFAAQTDAGDRA